ncbi:hypothetical protein HIM_12438 [Hirsutella minnesotensis 3608]|uniref:Major facilitator superfamily (MFS) profile domain-containing protein n=1 Tax=Hirsutella minnesotensis 3608 TaxID=1043627 RepID=A0A0F7ZI15_9HYPO|nr:hypothetical protein HIM_12438 [Hirsutella minnesotensis 3608]
MNSSATDRDYPPGTTKLIHDKRSEGFEGVALWPAPSDDFNDPLTWASFRKAWNFGLLTAMTMTIFALLSIQVVFWPQMVPDLNTTVERLNRGSVCQLAGLALGCPLFIPFAKKYGRRPVYLASVTVIAIGTWWSAYMKTSAEVIATNLVIGLAGAINEAQGGKSLNCDQPG